MRLIVSNTLLSLSFHGMVMAKVKLLIESVADVNAFDENRAKGLMNPLYSNLS